MSNSGPRRRADAAQNRELILAAATTALAESSQVSLNAIAMRAGVANATLYRHFPTRQSLVFEVYRHEVEQVVEAADRLLATRAPGEALREWVQRLARYAMTKHGLADALRTATGPGTPLFAETYELIVAALAKLLSAAERAGVVRPAWTPTMSFSRSPACGRSTRHRTGRRGPAGYTSSFSPDSRPNDLVLRGGSCSP